MYQPAPQNSKPYFHNAVTTSPAPNIWPQVFKGLLMAGSILTAFIPGADEVIPQFLIAEAYGGSLWGVNHAYGISNSWVNVGINLGAPVIGGWWGLAMNANSIGKIVEFGNSAVPEEFIANNALRQEMVNHSLAMEKAGWGTHRARIFTKFGYTKEEYNKMSKLYINYHLHRNTQKYVKEISQTLKPWKNPYKSLKTNVKEKLTSYWKNSSEGAINYMTRRIEKGLNNLNFSKLGVLDEIRKNTQRKTEREDKEKIIAKMLGIEDVEEFKALIIAFLKQRANYKELQSVINTMVLPFLGDSGEINTLRYEFFRILKETKEAYEMGKAGEEMAEADVFHATVAVMRKKHASFWKQAQKNIAYEQRSGWQKIKATFSHKNIRKVSKVSRALNPSNLGRLPINMLYRQLRKFAKKFGNKLIENIGKSEESKLTKKLSLGAWAKVMKKGIEKSYEGFLKAGIIPLDSSWLSEMKIIGESPVEHLIMVTFQGEKTNYKPPVFRWMNDIQIKSMIQSPGSTYDNIFAASRGGKSVSVMQLFGNISGKKRGKMSKVEEKVLGHILAFLPIQSIRSILSITSNIKKFGMRIKSKSEFQNFLGKINKSMINTSISRATRLVARGLVGDLVGERWAKHINNKAMKFLVHHALGMEVQRVLTYSVSNTLKDMYAGKKNKHLWKAMEGKMLYGLTRTVRDQSNAFIRHKNPYSFAVANIAVRRKLRIVKRAWPLVRNWKTSSPKQKTAKVYKPRIKKNY